MIDPDTDIGGPAVSFPATRSTILAGLRSSDSQERTQAFESLVAEYWKPIYKYIRLKWALANEEAKDLTQGFLTCALEKDFFACYDPAKARFRTFLRTCLDGFVANEKKAAGRIKRGGHAELLSLDFDGAAEEIHKQSATSDVGPEHLFQQEWVRSLLALAVEDLRQHCESTSKREHFALFEIYDLEGADTGVKPTYAELGQKFNLTPIQVTNHLAWARRQFRTFVLSRLRALTGTEEEFQEEVERLLGGACK